MNESQETGETNEKRNHDLCVSPSNGSPDFDRAFFPACIAPLKTEQIGGESVKIPDESKIEGFHIRINQALKYGVDKGSKNTGGRVIFGYGRAGLRYELWLSSYDSSGEKLESEFCVSALELGDWKKPSPAAEAPEG